MAGLRPAGPGWLVEQVNIVGNLKVLIRNFSAQLSPSIIFVLVTIPVIIIIIIIMVIIYRRRL